MAKNRAYAVAAAMGVIAGLRSLTAPALVSVAANRCSLPLRRSPLRFLTASGTAIALGVLAAGELIMDKLPNTPNRTMPGSLAARILSGAGCGAAICISERECVTAGAVIGGIAAAGGTFAGYQLRKLALDQGGAIAAAAATVEDMIAVGGGSAALALAR
jgi:uncharacterized membrane protein